MKIIIYLCIFMKDSQKAQVPFVKSQKAQVPFVFFDHLTKGTCAFCDLAGLSQKAPVPSVNSQKASVPFDSGKLPYFI
jgi:hypothetical protein